MAGLYGAIACGLFASLFGGTPSQISGPTGPITVVMAVIIAQFQHDPAMAFTVVMIGGFFQLLFSFFKIGRYIDYIPYVVVSGFMNGIGSIIIIMQIAPFLGFQYEGGNFIKAIARIPEMISSPSIAAVFVGIITLFTIIFWPKKIRMIVPSALAALIIGTIVSIYSPFGDVSRIGEIPDAIPHIILPSMTIDELPSMIGAGLLLAALGTIDSLLTSLVADTKTGTVHNSDKELFGQGIGNIVAGLIGGISGAGATMRTMVNINAGGTTRISGIIHSITLTGFMIGLGFLVEKIPHAVLAGILIKVGWDIIDWNFIKMLIKAGRKNVDRNSVFIMSSVWLLTIFTDLLSAVAAGIIMKSMVTARRLSAYQMSSIRYTVGGEDSSNHAHLYNEEEIELLKNIKSSVMVLSFSGALTYGTARELKIKLRAYDESIDTMILDFSGARMIDASVMMTIVDLVEKLRSEHVKLIICGTNNHVYDYLYNHGVFDNVITSSNRYESLIDGLHNL